VRPVKNNEVEEMNLYSKEITMNKIFADADVGRKNVVFGIVLFLILGVVVGIPLTIDFLGGSILASDQYQTWKVVHAYGVFLAFINYFLGLTIDRLEMPKQHKEIVSWSFLMAGLIGGVGRMICFRRPERSGVTLLSARRRLF
jgi:hypothetical protein